MTGVAGERPIRTFHPRRGRMSGRHHGAFADLWPAYGITVVDGDREPLDLDRLFGRPAPKVLEIGFGMGETTAAMARADPGRDYLAVEVHTPGIGNLLALIGEHGLSNVRVAHGDAMELVHRLAADSLDAVHVFFPDPWPKARHHKRRLVSAGNVMLLRQRLRPGGVLHCATDWPHYAEAMRAVLDADPGLCPLEAAPAQISPASNRPARDPAHDDPGHEDVAHDGSPQATPAPGGPAGPGRPETRFERRGRAAGRPITDLIRRRV